MFLALISINSTTAQNYYICNGENVVVSDLIDPPIGPGLSCTQIIRSISPSNGVLEYNYDEDSYLLAPSETTTYTITSRRYEGLDSG